MKEKAVGNFGKVSDSDNEIFLKVKSVEKGSNKFIFEFMMKLHEWQVKEFTFDVCIISENKIGNHKEEI